MAVDSRPPAGDINTRRAVPFLKQRDIMRTANVHSYNYPRFRTRHLVNEAVRTWQLGRITPGDRAPSVDLPDAEGQPWSLGAHRNRPVLLHFGSYS